MRLDEVCMGREFCVGFANRERLNGQKGLD